MNQLPSRRGGHRAPPAQRRGRAPLRAAEVQGLPWRPAPLLPTPRATNRAKLPTSTEGGRAEVPQESDRSISRIILRARHWPKATRRWGSQPAQCSRAKPFTGSPHPRNRSCSFWTCRGSARPTAERASRSAARPSRTTGSVLASGEGVGAHRSEERPPRRRPGPPGDRLPCAPRPPHLPHTHADSCGGILRRSAGGRSAALRRSPSRARFFQGPTDGP